MSDTRIDTSENPLPEKVQRMVEIGNKLNKGKVPLRIDSITTIMVKPDKATYEYAEEYRRRYRRIYIKTE